MNCSDCQSDRIRHRVDQLSTTALQLGVTPSALGTQ
jgi:hypothetical protein